MLVNMSGTQCTTVIHDRESEVEMAVLHGSCVCGGVKYEITGPLIGLLNCHCSRSGNPPASHALRDLVLDVDIEHPVPIAQRIGRLAVAEASAPRAAIPAKAIGPPRSDLKRLFVARRRNRPRTTHWAFAPCDLRSTATSVSFSHRSRVDREPRVLTDGSVVIRQPTGVDPLSSCC